MIKHVNEKHTVKVLVPKHSSKVVTIDLDTDYDTCPTVGYTIMSQDFPSIDGKDPEYDTDNGATIVDTDMVQFDLWNDSDKAKTYVIKIDVDGQVEEYDDDVPWMVDECATDSDARINQAIMDRYNQCVYDDDDDGEHLITKAYNKVRRMAGYDRQADDDLTDGDGHLSIAKVYNKIRDDIKKRYGIDIDDDDDDDDDDDIKEEIRHWSKSSLM